MRCLQWVVLGLLTVWTAVGFADESDAAALVALLQPVGSLSASFEQTVRDDRGEILQRASGEMQVMRPNRLRWQTNEPFHYLVVTDGDVLWRYDADLEQANREPFRGELADAPGLILGGDPQRIVQQYDVRREKQNFVLEPRDQKALFKRLTLTWDKQAPRKMILQDRLDQITEIEFSAVQVNPELPTDLFVFTPPAEADVIRHE